MRVVAGGGGAAECAVTVEPLEQPLVDPASLRQYDDNRKFAVDGRLWLRH